MDKPEQLVLPGMGVTTEVSAVVEIGGQEPSRSERIALECIADDEPFFVLRAKDTFAVMGVNNYSKLAENLATLCARCSLTHQVSVADSLLSS